MKYYILNIWDSNDYYGDSYNYLINITSEFISFINRVRTVYFEAIKDIDDIDQEFTSCKIRIPNRFLKDILLIKNEDIPSNISLKDDINSITLSDFKELSLIVNRCKEDHYRYVIIYRDRIFIETLLNEQILKSYDIEEIIKGDRDVE